ncbi:hypothetical protein DEJ16_13895 [Curtobacterium sp. MCJR17_055]|uniref:hypothetical protein n=1 Tax=unclassified Curtobacterium TaxID=257496 RepID=UPI000D9CF1CF|nr:MULTISPECIES: hypothetical protein [unclassified Curtobacterium]PYY33284.1 hypothetical protein DEI87_12355 [Curtobacterium sp. MCBD17_029]PYY53227.1 hypothetical protein DEJ16_13895 [Curtobacterium sp. MCJR17_055]PYY56382.1 hypothetical protein DEJ26_13135 [Curtobacterium sp. MCPF17_015]PZE90072.1 hypothetical protein DEI95_12520 [Curtobacterium sp. MCBD17_008]WIB35690.1 hypothetical protein DEJ15_16345 [Curtobacterium sp. MCJR17_043]
MNAVDHLVDLDALALLLRPHLDDWARSAAVGPLTWRDEDAAWPQPIERHRSRVSSPESLGLRLWRGSDELELVVWTGGWADADRFVDGRLEATAPDFTDADSAYAAVVDLVAEFLHAAGVDPA